MIRFDDRIRKIDQAIWSQSPTDLPAWKARGVRAARFVIVLFRDVVEGELTLWTMSLVYTTLLSMVPLLAAELFGAEGVRRAQPDQAVA